MVPDKVLLLCMIEVWLGEMSFIICLGEMFMYLGKQVMNLLQFIMLAMLPLLFVERTRKWLLEN
jgi:branched-subunit amino acid transport protein